MTTTLKGYLEIDEQRGVIYFHSEEDGTTKLRICRLPIPIPDPASVGGLLDITHMFGTSWKGREDEQH